MKILVLLAMIFLFGCYTQREVGFEDVTIVKVDTVYRFGENKLEITLRTEKGVEYPSFCSIHDRYIIGTHYKMVVKK